MSWNCIDHDFHVLNFAGRISSLPCGQIGQPLRCPFVSELFDLCLATANGLSWGLILDAAWPCSARVNILGQLRSVMAIATCWLDNSVVLSWMGMVVST